MITIQSRLHVSALWGGEVLDFLLNCTDEEYRAWWPGTHLQLHALARRPGDIGSIYYMDEFVGGYRLRMTAVVCALEPGKRIVWQLKRGITLPARLTLDLADDAQGVAITHTIEAGFRGLGRLLDPLLRLYLSHNFERAMDEHVRTEFPRLRDLLRQADHDALARRQADQSRVADPG
ncbi:MAG TPA: hypothetical protein VG758_23455 [Hyphomicrobiaceae bacterium]|jgi:hypothetical protein|nr:hypothetical protein [Hyphomicrobiaceae bacterium]